MARVAKKVTERVEVDLSAVFVEAFAGEPTPCRSALAKPRSPSAREFLQVFRPQRRLRRPDRDVAPWPEPHADIVANCAHGRVAHPPAQAHRSSLKHDGASRHRHHCVLRNLNAIELQQRMDHLEVASLNSSSSRIWRCHEPTDEHFSIRGRPSRFVKPAIVISREARRRAGGVSRERGLPEPARQNLLLVRLKRRAFTLCEWTEKGFDPRLKRAHPAVIAMRTAEHLDLEVIGVSDLSGDPAFAVSEVTLFQSHALGQPFGKHVLAGLRRRTTKQTCAHGESPISTQPSTRSQAEVRSWVC